MKHFDQLNSVLLLVIMAVRLPRSQSVEAPVEQEVRSSGRVWIFNPWCRYNLEVAIIASYPLAASYVIHIC